MDFLGGTNGYILMKTLHVVAAVAWVGGALTQNIMATRLKKSGNGELMGNFAKQAEWIGTHLYLPASARILGLAYGCRHERFNFHRLWIIIGIAVILATVVTGRASSAHLQEDRAAWRSGRTTRMLFG